MTELERIATFGLEGLESTTPIVPGDWGTFIQDVERHRLAGLLTAATRAGAVDVAADRLDDIEAVDARWQRHALLMARLLRDVVEALSGASIPHRVIKGPALAHLAYDDPAHRVHGDIDVVIPGADLERTRRLLVSEFGAEDPFPEIRPGFDAAYAKDVLIRVDGAEIDLHRTLASGPFGHRVRTGDLFEDATTFDVGGTSVPTIGPDMTFVQVCYNAALGDIPPRLVSLRDVAQVHRALRPDPDAVIEIADRWGGLTVVATAITLTWDAFGLPTDDLSGWSSAHRPGPVDRRYLDASRSAARSYTRHLATLASIRGVRAKLGYARAIGRPDEQYLAARGWTARSHATRAIRRLLGR
ncbi:MAG: nucleotidyltransferase family protein [Actinomycetota bacterium]